MGSVGSKGLEGVVPAPHVAAGPTARTREHHATWEMAVKALPTSGPTLPAGLQRMPEPPCDSSGGRTVHAADDNDPNPVMRSEWESDRAALLAGECHCVGHPADRCHADHRRYNGRENHAPERGSHWITYLPSSVLRGFYGRSSRDPDHEPSQLRVRGRLCERLVHLDETRGSPGVAQATYATPSSLTVRTSTSTDATLKPGGEPLPA
jgi:hypothetical protein